MKRIIAVLLVGIMMVSVCSCGKQNTSSGGVAEVTWYFPGDKTNDLVEVQNKINEYLEPEIGARLKLMPIDSSAYKEKMQNKFSSGEEVDICFAANWSLQLLTNVEKEAFLPLDELIDKNAPKLKEELPEYLWESTKVNGEIYAVPNYQILPTWFCLMVDPDLVKKYNWDFSNVKELKDIEPFLKDLKENEPNLTPYLPGYYDLQMKYEQIYPTSFVFVEKTGKDLKAVPYYETQEYKDYLKLIYDWVQKGYVSKEMGVDTTAKKNALQYGFFWGTYKPGQEADEVITYKKALDHIMMCDPYTQSTATARTLSAISRTSKHPELAIKVLEVFNTNKDLYNLLCYGIEGKHYEKLSDGRIKILDSDNYKMDAWKFGNQFNAYIKENQELSVWDDTKKVNDEAIISPIWGFNLDSSKVLNEITQCDAVIGEFSYLIQGLQDGTKDYDKFVNKMKAAGADKVIEEVQRQLDEFKKTKK